MLTIIIISTVLLLATSKRGDTVVSSVKFLGTYSGKHWYQHLVKECIKNDVPINLMESLIYQESKGNEYSIGSSGEIGLFQLKRIVAQEYENITGQRIIDIEDAYNNITIGVWYYASLLRRYRLHNFRDALLAYNSGIGNFRAGKIQDYNYADKILERTGIL